MSAVVVQSILAAAQPIQELRRYVDVIAALLCGDEGGDAPISAPTHLHVARFGDVGESAAVATEEVEVRPAAKSEDVSGSPFGGSRQNGGQAETEGGQRQVVCQHNVGLLRLTVTVVLR